MSIKTRALVFSTFLGSCAAIGLLLVSLTTNYWVRASPKRHNTLESIGNVNYGLFFGNTDLNVGYGDRPVPTNVYTLIASEPDIMNFGLWLVTALGTGFGLLSCAIAAIASVVKSASASKKRGTMALLFVSNISSALSQILAFVCWVIQFYQYLTHNVLTFEDRTVMRWYSHGTASFGFSFYMLVLSIIIVLINIVVLIYAKRREHREDHRFEPPSEEKNQNAIMLY